MNTRQWAVLFVGMLSFEHATATFFFGNYKGVSKRYASDDEGYYGWSQGCRCNEDLTDSLDGALTGVRSHFGRYHHGLPLKNRHLEEYEFKDGACTNVHKFERRGPYRCSLSRDYVRIFFIVRFFKLIVHYYVSLVEDILYHFFGGIGSIFWKFFGHISDFFFRCAFPDVYVTVVLYQRLGAKHQGFQVEGMHLNNLEKMEFVDKKFKQHESSFLPYFKPVFDHALRNAVSDKMGGVFTKHFRKVSATKKHFYYEKGAHGNDGEYGYDESYGHDEERYDETTYDEDSYDED